MTLSIRLHKHKNDSRWIDYAAKRVTGEIWTHDLRSHNPAFLPTKLLPPYKRQRVDSNFSWSFASTPSRSRRVSFARLSPFEWRGLLANPGKRQRVDSNHRNEWTSNSLAGSRIKPLCHVAINRSHSIWTLVGNLRFPTPGLAKGWISEEIRLSRL